MASNRASISLEQWESKMAQEKIPKEGLNKLVMNYLVTEGYADAAKMFEKESGTAPGIELGSIAERVDIRQSVQSGDVEAAIEKVNDLNPEILETQPHLFFHLQQQRLIELIRSGQEENALDFAQEYLAPQGEERPELLEELERTVALLAFQDAKASPVGMLMDVTQRQKTASELNAAILGSQCQDSEPRLHTLIRMMIWAQKQLDEKCNYPHISDLASGELTVPKSGQ